MESFPNAVVRITRGLDDDSGPDSGLDVTVEGEVLHPGPELDTSLIDERIKPVPFREQDCDWELTIRSGASDLFTAGLTFGHDCQGTIR